MCATTDWYANNHDMLHGWLYGELCGLVLFAWPRTSPGVLLGGICVYTTELGSMLLGWKLG